MEYFKGDFILSTDKLKIDKNKVYKLLSNSYWANTRSKEIIDRSIENSLCFSLFFKEEQIGFARVVTDYSVFAYFCDFIIDEQYCKQGLGKWCLECILNYPNLKGLKRWSLDTKDAQGFYNKFGFETLEYPQNHLEKINKNLK